MIVCYAGRKGRGKTLSAVKDLYTYYLNGWKCYSNMKSISFADYVDPNHLKEIHKHDYLRGCVILVDEIQSIFDSRRSMNKGNLEFSHFLQQIRKFDVRLLCTVQVLTNMDLRVREQMDIVARPQLIKEFDVCRITYFDETSVEDNFGFGDEQLKPSMRTVIFDARAVYGMYNTKESIHSEVENSKKK